MAGALSFFARTNPEMSEDILAHHWIPFAFIASSIMWVVVSRVVDNFARTFLYIIWVSTILMTAVWGASHLEYGGAVSMFCVSMGVTFFLVSILVNYMPMNSMFADLGSYFFISCLVASIAFMVSPFVKWLNGSWFNTAFMLAGVCSVIFSTFQLWNLWHYVQINRHLLQIHNTCMFAVMSPWSETVDTFAVLSRFN
jgi:hypothetical protein